jgi:hypothetical protein
MRNAKLTRAQRVLAAGTPMHYTSRCAAADGFEAGCGFRSIARS